MSAIDRFGNSLFSTAHAHTVVECFITFKTKHPFCQYTVCPTYVSKSWLQC